MSLKGSQRSKAYLVGHLKDEHEFQMLRVPGDRFEHFEQNVPQLRVKYLAYLCLSRQVFWYVWIIECTGQQQDGKVMKGLVRSLDSKRN